MKQAYGLKELVVWSPNCKANRIFGVDFAGFKLLMILPS